MKIKPITPTEAEAAKERVIPEEVILIFNQLIVKHLVADRAVIEQEEVVNALVAKGFERRVIFDNKMLQITPVYNKAGWTVEYDKPGHNETYSAKFTFTKRKRPIPSDGRSR